MSNGNIFREIKDILKTNPESLTIEARDRLVLEGIVELHERIDAMTKISTGDLRKLEKHEVSLYGTDTTKGHEARIKSLEDKMTLILWIIAGIITPLLAAIGIGILRILQEATL